MVRNAGESLGVNAWVDLIGAQGPLFASDSEIQTLYKLESQLAGEPAPTTDHRFHGLTAPRWPDSLPRCANANLSKAECVTASIADPNYQARIAHGAELYASHCASCHLPPITAPGFWEAPGWNAPDSMGGRFIDLKMEPITDVGTDDRQAVGLADRKVFVPTALHLKHESQGRAPFGPALGDVVESVVTRWYDEQSPPAPAGTRSEMDGARPNGIRAPLAYKVRPLDGIWATPPYLHNGSVPTVFDLLSPAKDRPQEFCLGHRDYDPVKLGLKAVCHSGDSHLVMQNATGRRPRDSNTGHEFSESYNSIDPSKSPKGIIGPALSVQDRLDIIEYLKSDEVNGFGPASAPSAN